MNKNLQTLCRVAILVALEIILSRFLSISTPELKIGFGFVPIALCGIMFGPFWALAAGATADFLGAVLLPIGSYFPGFTLTAALTGLCFGLFLHRKNARYFPNVVLCAIVNCVFLSFGLNTFWISVISGSPFIVLASTRVVQLCVTLACQLALLPLLQKVAKMPAIAPHFERNH
ncbi:MAG: folate family ECF transporter S component [Oscillospiraceae bacterium]